MDRALHNVARATGMDMNRPTRNSMLAEVSQVSARDSGPIQTHGRPAGRQ